MKKALMLSAMVIVVGATAAHAKKAYTFGTPSGGSYCDGITNISTSGANLAAVHQYSGCGINTSSYLGGVEAKIGSLGSGNWYSLANSSTGYDEPTTIVETYIVSFHLLAFDAYYESAYYGIPFTQYISGGKLVKGYNAIKVKGAVHESTTHAAMKAAGLIH